MILKYLGFLLTLFWSYSFIKTQSLFKKGSGFLITLFVSNISWFTFIAACFYGFKNFKFYYVLIGIGFIFALVQLTFGRLSLFINSKFQNKENLISVFLPTTPNPTSGFLLFVPKEDILILDMSVEEAAKLVISAGLVVPEKSKINTEGFESLPIKGTLSKKNS